jgi:integrase
LPNLTKTTIDAAMTKPSAYVLWDSELSGFGCRVFPSGKRSFVLKYRLPGDRRSFLMALGAYGELTVKQARERARDELAKVRLDDQHPLAARRALRATKAAPAALTVASLAEQYVAALHAGIATTKRLRGRQACDAYLEDTARHLRRFADAYGVREPSSISRGDVVRLLNDYIKQPSVHRRMHGAISRMYDWAQKGDLVAANPADHVDTTMPPSRERVLSLEELARVWRAADQLEHVYRDAVQLMIVTGQRRAEVASMVWGEIDLARALWTLPAARTKARRQHVLPLAPLAVTTLQARRAAFQHAPAPADLVLPTIASDGKGSAPISGWSWLKRELDHRSGVTEWRQHDFRRSIVSICAEHGADIAVLDSMLNHASSATRGGVIGTYQRALLIEPTRKVMALWDGLLREAIGLPPAVAVGPKLVSVA